MTTETTQNGPQPGPQPETQTQAQAQAQIKRAKKGKKSKKNKKNLNDPMIVIKDILDKTSYKKANLSQIIQMQFYEAPKHREELREKLSDIVYSSTIGDLTTSMSVNDDHYPPIDCVSVTPLHFKGQISPSPSAIMSLTSIEDAPKKRVHYRKGKRRPDKGSQKKVEEKRAEVQKAAENKTDK